MVIYSTEFFRFFRVEMFSKVPLGNNEKTFDFKDNHKLPDAWQGEYLAHKF